MKWLGIVLLLFTLNKSVDAQTGYLGQTKTYIVNQNSNCRITGNTDQSLDFDCLELTSFYFFDGDPILCSLSGMEFPKTKAQDFKANLIDKGYQLVDESVYPILMVPKVRKEGTYSSSPVKIYSNKEYVITILEYDFEGYPKSKKFGVYFEIYTEEQFGDYFKE